MSPRSIRRAAERRAAKEARRAARLAEQSMSPQPEPIRDREGVNMALRAAELDESQGRLR
jgi:hypothetical protein